MNVSELISQTGWQLLGSQAETDREVTGVYVGDLLSWVMGKGSPGQAWITVQAHVNVIAVGVLREFACIILADHAEATPEMLQRAAEEHLALIQSGLPAYESAKKLVQLGL